MVIGERFVWAHLPKTGGSATLELFKIFPEVVLFGDFDDSNVKHTSFAERADRVAGKSLAMNIRRLPFWVLSRAHHVARHGLYPDYVPIRMPSAEELSESDFPDSRISWYTDSGRFRIDHWIRMERLTEDFLAFISAYADVTDDRRRSARSLRM